MPAAVLLQKKVPAQLEVCPLISGDHTQARVVGAVAVTRTTVIMPTEITGPQGSTTATLTGDAEEAWVKGRMTDPFAGDEGELSVQQ
eukprot:1108417-Rhodomonas_salina.1